MVEMLDSETGAHVRARMAGQPELTLSGAVEALRAKYGEVKRVPVKYRYDALLPGFLKQLAEIGHHAAEKYESWEQYLSGRLEGDKAPINHVYEHLRMYAEGEPYDAIDGDPRRHLAAVAYNVMMEWAYHTLYGPKVHPLTKKLEELAALRRTETT